MIVSRNNQRRDSRTFDENSDEELDIQEEQNNIIDMNMLSNSMERLRISQPIEPSSRTKKKDIQIRKKHEGAIYIKNHKPVEHCNTIVIVRKIHWEIQ